MLLEQRALRGGRRRGRRRASLEPRQLPRYIHASLESGGHSVPGGSTGVVRGAHAVRNASIAATVNASWWTSPCSFVLHLLVVVLLLVLALQLLLLLLLTLY